VSTAVTLIARYTLFAASLLGGCVDTANQHDLSSELGDSVPNNYAHDSSTGKAASFSLQGEVRFDGEFFQAQGTNGRSCATCHAPEDGWSIRVETARRFFDQTDGLHPLFSRQDANVPGLPDDAVDSVEERRAQFTMLLKGLFTRNVTLPADNPATNPTFTRQFDLVEVNDPFGVSRVTGTAGSATGRMWFFRRPLPTANFKSHRVMWDGANTVGVDLRAGLVKQAIGNVSGAQQGPVLLADDPIIQEIVSYEADMFNAQLRIPGVGRLDEDGATGGPEHLAYQPLEIGPFTLFDAWTDDQDNPRRAQIARGQALFNGVNANGRSCAGCHNAANDGQSFGGTMFDVGASNPQFANADMAVFTFQNRETGERKQSTDGGRGIRTGLWADLNKFKTPSLRGLAARPPFFHNGIAATLGDVVAHYQAALGFVYTPEEAADLVAFMNAL
jgi:cytochrome c peroxidase